MGIAVLHTHILGLFPVRDLAVFRISQSLDPRECWHDRIVLKFDRILDSIAAETTTKFQIDWKILQKCNWRYLAIIQMNIDGFVWHLRMVYLQCVSNGGCSHAYYILGLFTVRNLTVLGSRKVPSRENVNTIASLWNLTGSSTALLPRRLPNFTAIGKFYGRSCDKTSWIGRSSF